jgi:hypothetical protein
MNYPAAETAVYQKVESMLSVVIPTCSESFFKKDSGQALNRMVQGKPE